MEEAEEAETTDFVLPLVPWAFDPANTGNLAGVLLIPRVTNFRVSITEFRTAIDAIDAQHHTQFLDQIPLVVGDEDAFTRTAQHFHNNGGALLRVPQPAARNPRYTWATTEVDANDMVSMKGQAWLEFRRDPKSKTGTVYFSTAQDGHVMPQDIVDTFDATYARNKLTFGTDDCRRLVAGMLTTLSAKLIGRNIWFLPTTTNLATFSDMMNAINKMAGYTALVAFEIVKTSQNETIAKHVITEVFKKHLVDATQAVDEYIADVKAYAENPKKNPMRYKSRATRGFNDVNALVRETQMYAGVLESVANDALQHALDLQRKWQLLYAGALARDGEFNGSSVILSLSEHTKKPQI